MISKPKTATPTHLGLAHLHFEHIIGHRIPAIENLGVAGPHDAIDFTDNDIQVLGNIPLSPRIRTLLLARNRIAVIQPSVANAIPNLRNLVLASNNLSELSDLDVLAKFPRLTHLVLVDNPVAKKEVCCFTSTWTRRRIRWHIMGKSGRRLTRA